jgi:predicted ATPase
MRGKIRSINVEGFRSLANVTVPVGSLTVLVGPNGSGKTNVLNVLRFLAATVRFDLTAAVDIFGGFDHILRSAGKVRSVQIEIEALVTKHASDRAPDRYQLAVRETSRQGLIRDEVFTFKRVSGRGRRITVNGSTVTIDRRRLELADAQTTGLSTLPKLAAGQGGEGIDDFARFVSSIRVLEPDVTAAREPSRLYGAVLAEDASNLPDALLRLREAEPQAFADVERDLALCLPGLEEIGFSSVGGNARSVVVQLGERGLSNPVPLADASFGTVRLLALLVALHEPDPPPLTAIEEIDHGLHPYALDVVVDALRAASERTQLLIATHSPTFVNRLEPDELVICDRDPVTGASLIPAVDAETLARAAEEGDLRLGELWFSGAVGGVPA